MEKGNEGIKSGRRESTTETSGATGSADAVEVQYDAKRAGGKTESFHGTY